MTKSKIIIAVGIYLALGGLVYFLSPSPDASGTPTRDEFTSFSSAWLVASGVGLILHKKWAYLLYLCGIAVLAVLIFVKSLEYGQGLSQAAIGALIPTVVFGVPAFFVWLRRDYLLSQKGEADNA